MNKLLNLTLIIISAINISVADAIIKHISTNMTFSQTIANPWSYMAYGLYLIEIWLSVLIFNFGGGFTIYTSLFMVFYSVFCLLMGNLIFHDVLTVTQIVGIGMGLIGAALMSF